MTTSHIDPTILDIEGIGAVPLTVRRWTGEAGRPVLVLHGGAGPQSVMPFCELLVQHGHANVIAPTHPGFGATPRPDALIGVSALARLYAALLEDLGLDDVTVFGNSIGGWVAGELALLSPQRVSRLILADAVGIEVEDHPVADPAAISPSELIARAFHDPGRFSVDPASQSPEARAVQAQDAEALAAYGGPGGGDRTLRGRLSRIEAATLLLWGESDEIVDLAYQRAYAAAIPRARLHLLADTGHLPQLETPHHVLTVVEDFIADPGAEGEPVWSAE